MIDIAQITLKNLKPGTSLYFIARVSSEVTNYLVQSVEDYKNLFFFDKETKRTLEILRD